MPNNRWKQFTTTHPDPGTDPVARLRHVLDVFSDTDGELDDPDRFAVTATTNLYGKGVTTGLTFGDLQALASLIDQTLPR